MRNLFVVITTLTAVNAAVHSLRSINFHDDKGEEKTYSVKSFETSSTIESNDDIENQVTFILFTRKTPDAEILTADNVAVTAFNPEANTKFLIHGYTHNGRKDYINNTAKAYLNNADINVISVDWGPLAATPDYSQAIQYIKIVGKVVGELIFRLHQEMGLRLEQVHITGHSLGAHTAGFSGKKVIELTGKRISRITGLDPAGPLFEFPFLVKASKRLDKSDALLVDVIHTDGGKFGCRRALGHIDFYPNGGLPMQPGCSGVLGDYCSHKRAFEFFTESIHNNNFLAQLCNSWKDFKNGKCEDKFGTMGEYLNYPEFGVYFLVTNAQSPYAKPEE